MDLSPERMLAEHISKNKLQLISKKNIPMDLWLESRASNEMRKGRGDALKGNIVGKKHKKPRKCAQIRVKKHHQMK